MAKWFINCDGYYPYCSNCKAEPQNRVMTKYCPNCGANMNLDGDEMEFKIKIKATTKDHIFDSHFGEFEKELKDRIETALYIELKDDYIKNENVDLEFEVE